MVSMRSKRLPLRRMFGRERGKIFLRSSETENLHSRISRTHLMPPAVEPPHPPMNMSPSRRMHAAAGQTAKFAVVNPVVVERETT